MNEENSRAAIVARVSDAVRNWEVDPPASFTWTRLPAAGTRASRFRAAAEAAAASVSVVPDLDGARLRVAEILSALDTPRVVVADDAFEAPWDIGRLAGAIAASEVCRASAVAETPAATMSRTALAGVTLAQYGVAATGTLVVCSSATGGRAASLLPPVHVALARSSDLVDGLPELLAAVARDRRLQESSAVTFITGPSRTADIELTLTIGVHGPQQLFIVLVDDTSGR